MITRRIARPLCRRHIIQISALSTFDGRIVAYYGGDGRQRIRVRFWRGSLRNNYHIQGRQQVRKLPNPDTGRIHWRASLVPAAAVIPAPIVYLKVVAVKKLVVGPRGGSAGPPHGEHRSSRPYCRRCAPGLNWPGRSFGAVTLKKLECSKQAYAYTILVSTINDADQGSADVAFRTPPAPYEKSKSLGFGGSMIIAIVGLQRGIPSKRDSSAHVDYVPALCAHHPSLLSIEWSDEVFGSRRCGRFAVRDVARSPLNLII
ncbi:hypothetical protein V6N13_051377 [Hibiscus sabdariffa]